MNIILIGFMGAGKTAVARELSAVLKKEAVDMDELIVKKSGRKSDQEIFAKDGELRFRELELEVARELGQRDDIIISTGGGAVMNQITMSHLQKNGFVIFLQHSLATARQRLRHKNLPPLFRNLQRAQELHALRTPLYQDYADMEIATDKKSIAQVVREIGSHICLVIGDPITHSLSPQFHNARYQAAGVSSQYIFLACRVSSQELARFMTRAQAAGIRGISVTMPHKVAVMKYLDAVDATAKKIGAVNTVVNRGGILTGYNTDWMGALDSIKKIISLKNKKVVIIGAGGAARAIAYGLASRGAKLFVYDRKTHHRKELARELRAADIIINATPVGMRPHADKTPISKKFISRHQVVMDVVYRPAHTRFLREAKQQGARVISGMEMFLAQAAVQCNLFMKL